MLATTETVRALLRAQAGDFAGLPILPVTSAGTDHHLFRLGDDYCVRLPKREEAIDQIEKEWVWLPRLAPLPLQIPAPVLLGRPNEAFDAPWAIYRWIEGVALVEAEIADWDQAAADMAAFLLALQAEPVDGAPIAGPENHYRGVPLAQRSGLTQKAIDGISDLYPSSALLDIWGDALSVDAHAGAPVWIHGDLQGGNILVEDGELSAIIDFGLSAVGDPAVDLIVAWSVLPDAARAIFKANIRCDAAAWRRGRGWALSVAVIALDFYRDRNPGLATISRQTIEAVLRDASLELTCG